MKRLKRSLLVLASSSALAVALTGAGSANVAAYGSDAIYQITFSFNCNNADFCQPSPENPFGLGGFWGWIELDGTPGATSGTDGDLVAEGCSHNPPTGPTGADHVAFDVVWVTIPTNMGPALVISVPSFPELGSLFLPATSGHYSMHPAPGIANEVEIMRIPGR